MRITTYNVYDRRIVWAEGTSITGNENVDKFHFEFDPEWDEFEAKFMVLIVNGTSYIDQLDAENNVTLRNVVYDKENVEFGVYGIDTDTSAKLSTNIIGIETTESIWGRIRDVSDLPSKTQWEIYTEEMLALLAQGSITLEACQQALTDTLSAKNTAKGYMDTTEGYKNTTKGYMNTTEGYKQDVAGLKQDTINIVSDFNANVGQKTTDFNNNASSKTNDFNSNYTDKLGTFNSNATSKTTDFNDNASSKTTTFNSNATNKTTAFNNNASSKTDDYNSNATSKTTAFNENYTEKYNAVTLAGTTAVGNVQTAENTAITNIETAGSSYDARINDLLDQIPVGTVEDTYINVQDSSDLPIKDIQVEGNTYQLQTTGKNLLQGLELGNIDSSTGEETSSTNSIRSINKINYDTTKTYYSSVNGNLSTFVINLRFYNQSDEYIGYSSLTRSGSNFNINKQTAVEDDTPAYFKFRVSTSYVPTVNEKLMISTSDNLTYEPYTGGQSTPNPSYPQNIKVVTVDNTVNVVGKNLCNGIPAYTNKPLQTYGNVSSTSSVSNVSQYIRVKENTQYTLSLSNDSNSRRIGYYYAPLTEEVANDPNFISTIDYSGNSTTFTTPAGCKYIRFSYYNTSTDIQLEQGSTATSYEPYKIQSQLLSLGSMELAKVENYQDKLFKAVDGDKVYDSLDSTTKATLTYGSWYKQGNVRKFTSCVTASKLQSGIRFNLRERTNLHDMISTTNVEDPYISNMFLRPQNSSTAIGLVARYNYGWGGLGAYVTNEEIINMIGSEKTAEQLKDWFDANVTMYVGINPDYDYIDYTEITDTTLIEQLEALYDLQTYKNVTNIFTVTENEEPILNVTYRKDLQTLTDKIALLDARLSLLE